jgi:hypothetical protein
MEHRMSLSRLWDWIRRAPSRPASRKPHGRRPKLETLEARTVPTTLVGLTTNNHLLTFDSAQPGFVQNDVRVTGLRPREVLLGIDTRASTGLLYGASQFSLYTIDPATGAATRLANLTARPKGTAFGIDFNPVVDRLRIVSNQEQNLRVDPESGAVTVDTALAYAEGDANFGVNPTIVGSAYTNNDNDIATSTTLYGIDFKKNVLVTQSPANSGTLHTVGALGAPVGRPIAGFDIGPDGIAYAAFTTAAAQGVPRLYTINLTTGQASLVGQVGAARGVFLRGLAALVPAQPVYAVTSTNKLITFNAASPEIITSSRALTGLQADENVTGIDFRPSNGKLYATTDQNHVYTINTATGAVTKVNDVTFTGAQFGVDFNPVADALRVVSDSDQNLRILGGGQGAATPDTSLAYAAGDTNAGDNPNVVGSAYSNNFPGATTTTLFGIDTLNNALVTQNPNAGTLTTVGALGVDPDEGSDLVGFDISSGGTAYAAMKLTGQGGSRFYKINTTKGAATPVVGTVAFTEGVATNDGIIGSLKGGSPTIVGIAVAPPVVRLQPLAVSVRENAGPAKFVVVRSGDTTAAATVTLVFTPVTATETNDYTASPVTVTFAAGSRVATFEVPIIDNSTHEATETFTVAVSKVAADRFTIDPALTQAIVTILDNDPA